MCASFVPALSKLLFSKLLDDNEAAAAATAAADALWFVVALGPLVVLGSLVTPVAAENSWCLVSDGVGAPAIDEAGIVVPVDVINELLSMPAARLIASCTIVFNDDMGSLLTLTAFTPVALGAFDSCCCLAFGVTAAVIADAVVGPFKAAWGCCLGDNRPGDVRLLTTELVGDKQLAIDVLFATTALDEDVVRLLVMEVKMLECSIAAPTEVALWWLLLVAIWLLFGTPAVLIGAMVDADAATADATAAADDADTAAGVADAMLDTGACRLEFDWRAFITGGCCCWLTACADAFTFELAVAPLAAVDANADEYCPFSVCAGGCDVLCLATAANAIGFVGRIIDDDNVEMDEACWAWDAAVAEAVPDFTVVAVDEMADTLRAADVVAGATIWFLLGVEHTIDLFCDEDIVVLLDEAVEFRSDLFARTAIGLTGCIETGRENKDHCNFDTFHIYIMNRTDFYI